MNYNSEPNLDYDDSPKKKQKTLNFEQKETQRSHAIRNAPVNESNNFN